MQTKELVRWALEMTRDGTTALVADMRETPLVQPTAAGGNHPLWVLGHLAITEGFMRQCLTGEANPVEHWAPLFAPGSVPSTDASQYPSFDDVLATFRELRASNLELVEELGEEGLSSPPASAPAGFESMMSTKGQTLLLTTLHNMVHYGQIADARRVAGHAPLM